MIDRDASLREAARLEDAHGVGDPYAAALRATRMPIVITDARQDDNPIVFANQAFVELSGYSQDEIVGRNCRFLQGPKTDRGEVARVAQAIASGENVITEILNYRKDGTTFWNALYVSPVFDEAGTITHFFGSQLDVTQKNRAAGDLRDANARLAEAKESAERLVEERTRDLRRALEQKTMLLHEVDHRVKNNLQLIASLILLQSRRISDPEVKRSLRSMLERVSALATVHRTLFQADDVTAFDVSRFIQDIAEDLIGATGREDITLELDLSPIIVEAARGSPIALIVNEVLTNALKHAFPERPGRLKIATRRSEDDFVVEITDDGVGRDIQHETVGFGQNLIELLAKQLSATIETEDAAPGARIRISLAVRAGADADTSAGH